MHVAHSPPAAKRHLKFDSFEAVLDEVRTLQQGYGKTGHWNLAQCCHHLAAAMNAQIDGGVNKAPWPARMVAKFFLRDAMFRSGRIRSGVPSPLEMGKNVGDEEQEIASLVAAIERVRQHEGPSHAHPFFGKLSADQWRQFHLIHCAHHLSFLVPRGEAGIDPTTTTTTLTTTMTMTMTSMSDCTRFAWFHLQHFCLRTVHSWRRFTSSLCAGVSPCVHVGSCR